MNLAELNMELKEEIELLEKEYSKIMQDFQTLLYLPHSLHGSLKLLSLMCSEQVKAQRGEESTQMKFETVEQFAKHLGIGIDIYVKYLEDKYGV